MPVSMLHILLITIGRKSDDWKLKSLNFVQKKRELIFVKKKTDACIIIAQLKQILNSSKLN